jgi:hypothetical protein
MTELNHLFSPIENASSVHRDSDVRLVRKEYGLSVIQAAAALGTSGRNLEVWEANPGMGPGVDFLRSQFENYVRENGEDLVSNMLFSVYPLKIARDILGFPIEEIAREFGGYSKAAWQKFESNDRVLDREILRQIEMSVREHFANSCKAAIS